MRTHRVALLMLLSLAVCWLASSDQTTAQTSRARVLIEIADSDDVIGPGDEVDVHIWVRLGSAGNSYALDFFHASGGPVVIDDGTPLDPPPEAPSLSGTLIYVTTVGLVVPAGTRHGRATLVAQVTEDGAALPLAEETLTIADPGAPIGSARISSTIENFASSGRRSSTSLRTREVAYLKLEVQNGRGAIANDGDVVSLLISAAGGRLTLRDAVASREHLLQITDAGAAGALIEFSLETLDRQPIHIDVYAVAIGADGSVRSNTLVVNFAGEADSLSVGEPSGTLSARHGTVRIPVSGLDSDGNRDELSTSDVQAEVIEGPEEADLDLLRVDRSRCSSAARDCEDGDVVLLVKSTTLDGESAAHGDYTIEIMLNTDPDDTAYLSVVHVVGAPVSMTLELLDGSNPAVRSILTASGRQEYEFGSGETEELLVSPAQSVYAAVTLRDEEGVLISDTSSQIAGDGVRLQIIGALNVSLFSAGEHEIIDGVAYLRFLVAGDEGRALVIATSRDLEQVASIVARDKARFGLDGLIKINAEDYTTWIGQNNVQASELWRLLAPRGISSILLYRAHEQRWLRWSVVNGLEIPGSVDFLIAYGDTLWLGG